MGRPRKKQLKKQMDHLRIRSDSAEASMFAEKLETWLEANKDRRGVRAKAIAEGYYSCVRFQQALQARSHEDSSIRHMAGKCIKAARHESFSELRVRLSSLHGQMSKAGKRKAEKHRQGAARTIQLDQQFELRELRSVTSIQHAGRALENCVAKQSCAKSYLEHPDTEMWTVLERAAARPRYLLRVDRSTNEIDGFEGLDGSTPKLERPFADSVLRALDVTGDDEEAFARIGAFSAFQSGQPDVEPIRTGKHLHWAWVFRSGAEIIIATQTRPGKRKHWSRFLRSGAGPTDHPLSARRKMRRQREFVSSYSNYLSEGDLLALVLDHGSFAERLRYDTVGGERDGTLLAAA